MDYTLTLDDAFANALNRWAKESGSSPEALIDSVVRGALQSRVEDDRVATKAAIVAAWESAPDTATKADILASVEAAKVDADAATEKGK